MKRILIAITLLVAFIATPVYAACDLSNVSGLPEAKVKELELACQTALDEATNVMPGLDVTNPEALSAYGTVAQEWAKALGIAANELGIAVDEFLGTGAGKLTAAVIIWQVAGDSILGIIIGIPLLIIVIVLGIKFARRGLIKNITYSETEKNWRGKPIVTSIDYRDVDESPSYWIGYVVTIILSIWIIAGVIIP
jgi:hypothetical protein